MSAVLERKPPKAKTCQKTKGGCGQKFAPMRSMQSACGVSCAQAMAQHKRDKERAKKEQEERRQTRAKREAMKTLPQLKKEAQIEFNRYIRLRDAGKPCICCGAGLEDGAVGGGFDAGHYRSVGSAPHLRFDERNVHAQTKRCNRYGAGRAVDYRIGLIARIGLAAVEALESDNAPKHYSRDDLIALKAEYRAKARELEKLMESA